MHLAADKESAFGLWGLYWLHQCGIPHRMCRFYLLLAGAHKEATLFLGFYSGFTSGEYHVIRVDFIVALRRTKGRGRRTLRSPPSPSSGLHLIHPWNPLRRGILAAAVYANLGFRYPVQVACPHFDISFGCFVFGLGLFAFQKISLGFDRTFFIIGRMDCSCLRLRGFFSVVFRRICAQFIA